MKDKLIQAVEAKSLKAEKPYFEIGDTVEVHCKIQEGDKTRIQIFSGTVIARKGSKMNEMFTVRRMVGEQGVERIFPINSPNIEKVVPIRSGKARRAKLYYLRKRTGKGVKLSQRHSEHTSGK
ncbi:50S ribosomal protein L19 [Anaerohalosphaeraceae bacterium U12dextr]